MLKINNIKLNKCRIPLITSFIVLGGIFLYQYLTFIPEYSSAESKSISTDTPVTITPTTPLAKWDDLEYMQQMTPQACASAAEGQSKPLIDNRDTSKSYVVTKLKGNAGCWMTENMDYDGGLRSYHHDTYGGYYNWTNAKTVCNFTGWELPSQTQYNTLLTAYSISNSATGSTTLRNAPLNFLYGGYYNGSLGNVGSDGNYWSSTPYGGDAFYLFFGSKYADLSGYNASYGFSVRCVAKATSSETPVDPSVGGSTGINDPNVSVTVPNIITLDVSNNVDIATESNKVNTGTFTTTVESNKDYTVSLNATANDTDATSLINYKEDTKVAEIPTIVNNEQPQPGTSSWGIRACTSLLESSCESTTYQPLPTKDQTNTFTTGSKGTNTHLFQIGIGISPDLPSGTYSTNILVTASQK